MKENGNKKQNKKHPIAETSERVFVYLRERERQTDRERERERKRERERRVRRDRIMDA